jgi:hypothetical protein
MRTAASIALTTRFESQIIKAFRTERAVSGPTARRLRDLGLKESRVLRELVTTSVIRKAGPERYFLDESVWAARRHATASHLILVVVAVFLSLGLGALYLSLRQ